MAGIAYASITETNFTWIVPSEASNTIYQWIQPVKDPLKVKLNEVIDVNLEVGCINSDCGDMNITLYYSRDSVCATQYFIDDGNDLRLETGSNPFNCGDMNSGDFCYAFFQLKGVKRGVYELWGKIESDNADVNYTSCRERTINIPQQDATTLLLLVTEEKDLLPLMLLVGATMIGGVIVWKKKRQEAN